MQIHFAATLLSFIAGVAAEQAPEVQTAKWQNWLEVDVPHFLILTETNTKDWFEQILRHNPIVCFHVAWLSKQEE